MRISRLARDWLATSDSRNKPHEKHMLEFEEFFTSRILRVIRDLGQVASDPQNYLPDFFLSVPFLIPLPTLFPHYPRNVRRTRSIHKKLLREKTLAKHLRVRDCLPIILCHFSRVYIYSYLSIYTSLRSS